MKSKSFDLEEQRLKKEIIKQKAKVVLLQVPEGLKAEAPRLARSIEETGVLVIVSADPCYGACDLALSEADSLGADILIHYGHSPQIQQEKLPVIYVDARARIGVKEAVRKAIPLLRSWSNIGLATTVQHIHRLHEVGKLLIEAGKVVTVGDAGIAKYPGQVTGCDYSNVNAVSDEADAFLFVGGGRFHGLGIAVATGKPTIIADLYEKRAYSIHNEARKMIMQRWASISEAKERKKFGVLICLKNGQRNIGEAMEIKQKLQKKGKKVVLFAAREITPETLRNFHTIDAFVNTACPRVSLDDSSNFPKPILNIDETLVAIGEMKWEELYERGWSNTKR